MSGILAVSAGDGPGFLLFSQQASVSAKTSPRQLFDFLNEHTEEHTALDLLRVHDSSRRQHEREIEEVFPGPLSQLREYAGPFALHTAYQQMEQSLMYEAEVVQLPSGLKTWLGYAFVVCEEVGFNWKNGEDRIGLVRSRWYQKPVLNVSSIPAVSLEDLAHIPSHARLTLADTAASTSNPLDSSRVRATDTLPSRVIFHETTAAVRSLTNNVRTDEDLQVLMAQLNDLRRDRDEELRGTQLQEPPILNPKGRPRSQRLTGVGEGQRQGGGGQYIAAVMKRNRMYNRACRECREQGHDRRNCPRLRS
ncbi:hypothetical protein H2248_004005 [Termitomyces sp. 'cryptogamus']|nr:hypothetical protein H2248_004005 [Termitomyces sp. 'cryptogamus']